MSLWKSRGMDWLVGSVGALFDVNAFDLLSHI
jgi:hypothetical protein